MTEARRLPYEKIRYRATLTGLSPIHIGGGAPEPACRYAIDEDTKTAYVLRESFVASRYAEGRITGSEYHRRPSPASVVPKTEPERSEAVLYEVKAPRVAASLDKEARPFVRNGFGQAFIPGTSIKGAIREALLFSLLVQDDRLRGEIAASVRDLIAEMKKSNPQSANGIRRNRNHASRLEERFRNPGAGGRADPKNDILRCMAVEDTPPDNRGFTLAAANIFSLSGGVLAPMIFADEERSVNPFGPVFLEFLDPECPFPSAYPRQGPSRKTFPSHGEGSVQELSRHHRGFERPGRFHRKPGKYVLLGIRLFRETLEKRIRRRRAERKPGCHPYRVGLRLDGAQPFSLAGLQRKRCGRKPKSRKSLSRRTASLLSPGLCRPDAAGGMTWLRPRPGVYVKMSSPMFPERHGPGDFPGPLLESSFRDLGHFLAGA